MSLPRRNAGGYRITEVTLQITASPSIVRAVRSAVELPVPPPAPTNEFDLQRYVASLTAPALMALRVLEGQEPQEDTKRYRLPSYQRVVIEVLSGGRVIGRVNGAQQTFNAHGEMTSPGLLAHPPQPGHEKR